MAPLSMTGKVRKRFLEAAVLLRNLGEVRGVPTAHGLDFKECAGSDRAQLLKRKFLDSFALICANNKGGDSVSAVCLEEGQREGTIIRIACNSGVKKVVLSNAQKIVRKLTEIAREEVAEETSVMLEIISVDLSRIRQYVDDLQACRETTKLSRSELENRISHSMGDIPPCHLESFFEWLENIYALERVDCANKESLMRFLRLAQRAKHDYLDLLNAAFRSDVGHLEKWLLIIFKLGRYGIASRAFFQLAMELPALFSPMVVESVPAPGKISVKNNEVDLGLALRRLFGTKEEEYIGRLSHIWNRKGDPRNYFSQQCPAHLTVHAELQLVGFYDENPQRMPSLRFIGVSKKSCYLCNRFLAIHPLAFRTSACHQKLYPASAPPFTVDSKTYDSYKSIAIKLTEMMEATIKQELDHRPKFLHKLVPPDSSAGVSLSGITESGSAPVMSGALVESLVGKKRLLQHSSLMRDCQLEQTEDFESLCISTRSPPSIPQAAETSEPGYGNLSFSRGGAVSMYRELPDRVMDVVLHVERANDSLKQETIRIAELLDVGTQQPSWEILVETLKLEGDFSIDFRTESDVLVVENHIIVENERQLLACLQYLRNADKLNGHGLVYHRRTVERGVSFPLRREQNLAGASSKRQSKWSNVGSFSARCKTGGKRSESHSASL